MSFALFPPEVNSGMIYSGPGSGALMAASTAWDGLAADLSATTSSVSSVMSGLTGSSWLGPTSAAATASISPYITWLQSAATNAAQMGSQAKVAASLFETTHAAVVPPPVIAANRAQLLALIATNFFGQNTPAIMATEAHYEVMWAQDAAALDSYSSASEANNGALRQQEPPPYVSHQQAAPVQQVSPQSFSAPDSGQLAHSAAASPATPSADPTGLGSLLGGVSGGGSTGLESGLTNAAMMGSRFGIMIPMYLVRFLMMIPQFARMASMGGAAAGLAGQTAGAGGTGTLMNQIGDFVNGKLEGAVGTLVGHFGSATNAISAKLAQAASVGSLKVPSAWAGAAEGMVRAAPVLPNTTLSAPVQPMAASSGLPGGPFGHALMGAMAGRGMGAMAAKAPKVVPRPTAGG